MQMRYVCLCNQLPIVCGLKAVTTENTNDIQWIDFHSRHGANKETPAIPIPIPLFIGILQHT